MNFNFDFESAFNAARAKTKNASAVQSIVSSEDIVKGMNTYFRYYQKDMWKCIEESIASDKAIDHKLMFKSGTGTGKTEVFKFISPYIIAKHKEAGNKEGLVFGFVCHRIGLSQDLSRRIIPTILNKYRQDDSGYGRIWFDPNYKEGLAGCNLPKDKIKFYIVNSGKPVKELQVYTPKHVKDFNTEELTEEIEKNRKAGIHSMFICLYQSLAEYGNKNMKNIDFDFLICDEIHALNTMGETIFNNCTRLFDRSKRVFYFSATLQFDKDDERYLECISCNSNKIKAINA